MVFMELFGLLRRGHRGVLLLPGDIFVPNELSPLLPLGVPSGKSPPLKKTWVVYSVHVHTFVHVLLLSSSITFHLFAFLSFHFVLFFIENIYFHITHSQCGLFLRWGLSRNLELPHWLASKPQRSLAFSPQALG